jgi:hypothetical protein
VLLSTGDFASAMEQLEQVRALDPGSPFLAELTVTAKEQRAVAETRAHLRAEFHEHLDAARGLLISRDFAGASARIADALRLRPGDPDAVDVQAQISREMRAARPGAARVKPAAAPPTGQAVPPPPGTAPPSAAAPPDEVRDKPEPKPRPARKSRKTPRDPAEDESDLRES